MNWFRRNKYWLLYFGFVLLLTIISLYLTASTVHVAVVFAVLLAVIILLTLLTIWLIFYVGELTPAEIQPKKVRDNQISKRKISEYVAQNKRFLPQQPDQIPQLPPQPYVTYSRTSPYQHNSPQSNVTIKPISPPPAPPVLSQPTLSTLISPTLPSKDSPYVVKVSMLSDNERRFHHRLDEAIASKPIRISRQVSLQAIFDVIPTSHEQSYKNKIDKKILDFLLEDAKTYKALVGIELDDSSHNRPERQERDVFVNDLFKNAGIPLLRFAVQSDYDVIELARKIDHAIQARQQILASALPTPTCYRCGKAMVLRTTRRGVNAGSQFWGCSDYPSCWYKLPYTEQPN